MIRSILYRMETILGLLVLGVAFVILAAIEFVCRIFMDYDGPTYKDDLND